MKPVPWLVLTLLVCAATSADVQQKQSSPRQLTPKQSAAQVDRLGLTCTQILQMPSADWLKKFTAAKDAAPPSTIQAITAYGKCYDGRTTRLAATLAKSGKGPLMGARGSFRDFQHALDDFTAKALASTDPPAGEEKKACAALYAKQFRYDFYLQYEQKNFNPPPLTPEESDAFTKSKNHFGELLGLLPEEKIHLLHSAFGQIFAAGGVPDATKVAVYLYAIYLLESPADPPYSPPPF